MEYHLNYDHKQTSGVIINTAYPNGCLYRGVELSPKLSFNFDSFIFSEKTNTFIVNVNGVNRGMSEEEKAEAKEVAINWVQALGQEGNPNEAQLIQMANMRYVQYLRDTDWYVIRFQETGVAIPDDVRSLRQQARESVIV